jgi:c-di-GMP-binding flagellar brake protein YcgR
LTEQRKHDRVTAPDTLDGRIVPASEIVIIDISLGGIHFFCSKQLSTGSRCSIALTYRGENVSLKGSVVRSIFKMVKSRSPQSRPLYEVAMEFFDLSENQRECLNRIVESITKKER